MTVPTLDDGFTWPQDAVEVARITGPWGVKGWVKVQPFAADPQAVFSSRRWYAQAPERPSGARAGLRVGPKTAASRAAPQAQPPAEKPALQFPALLKVAECKVHGDGVVARLHEVDDRTAAEGLKGVRLFVPRSSFPTAATDEYYWVDLIGLPVVNRQGEALGVVEELFNTGAHSVLRLTVPAATADQAPTERMIPFVAAYIDSVDIPGRLITADWGLDY